MLWQRAHVFMTLLLLYILLLSFTGCEELGLLDGVAGDPLISVNLADDVLKPGDEIGILIDAEENIPDRVSASLENNHGESLSLELSPPEEGWVNISGIPGEMIIPETVSEGYYTLVSEAWLGEKLLAEDRKELLVLFGDWTIESLELFPPQSIPGGVFYSQVVLDIPEDSNPWLKWILDEDVVAEGWRSDGWDAVILEAGNSPGVRSLTVELYTGNSGENFRPVRSFSTELYVSESIPAGRDTLLPPESYVFLQHFDGKLEGEPDITGKPRPVITSMGMGFRFVPGDSMCWDDIGFPPDAGGGRSSFSLTIDVLSEERKRGELLTFNGDGLFLELFFSDDGALHLVLEEDEVFTLFLPVNNGNPVAVTLSFQLEEETSSLAWLINGETVGRCFPNLQPAVPGDSFRICLGGENGFSGVVTELGLHAPGIETDRFAFYQDSDEEAIVAEGFEDSVLEPVVEIDPAAVVDGGSLFLPPGGKIRVPGGGIGECAFSCFPADDSIVFSVFNSDTEELISRSVIPGKISVDSSERIVIPLEKEGGISDNNTNRFYELRASDRNTAVIRMEHIVVSREHL